MKKTKLGQSLLKGLKEAVNSKEKDAKVKNPDVSKKVRVQKLSNIVLFNGFVQKAFHKAESENLFSKDDHPSKVWNEAIKFALNNYKELSKLNKKALKEKEKKNNK